MLAALTPTFAISYLYFLQDDTLRFESFSFHEVAITVATVQGGFIAYVTYRCYLQTKETFLRWLTLGFLGFTIIYGLHGLFTRFTHDHFMLFSLYGPASRVVMSSCLLAGLVSYLRQEHEPQALSKYFWWAWLGVFAVINILVFQLASPKWARASLLVMDLLSLCIWLTGALMIFRRPVRPPLMTVYGVSVILFAQTSLAFLLDTAWSHTWWLAHIIFASAFMLLSYAVLRAFLTTGSFTQVYSQTELFEQISTEKARTEEALLELQRAHEELEVLAATDALTGCANRREFEKRSIAEIARAKRSGAPLSFVMIDLDHFKKINDQHGHRAGDEVLRMFSSLLHNVLRPSDFAGRIGGEEFALILPDTSLENAAIMAERLRQIVEREVVTFTKENIRFTVSIGIAQLGPDGRSYASVIEVADSRMYLSKHSGRNRVTTR